MRLKDKFQMIVVAGKGRGVAATAPLHVGEILEIAPTILLSHQECEHVAKTRLDDYYFAHPESAEDGLIVLGIASLLNHANRPNAEVEWRRDPQLGWIAVLKAIAPINTGEEITRRYACAPWFEVVGAQASAELNS